jgi:hypothetical protein
MNATIGSGRHGSSRIFADTNEYDVTNDKMNIDKLACTLSPIFI